MPPRDPERDFCHDALSPSTARAAREALNARRRRRRNSRASTPPRRPSRRASRARRRRWPGAAPTHASIVVVDDHVVVLRERPRTSSRATSSRRRICSSLSLLRPRSRVSSTSNDGGSTNTEHRRPAAAPHLPRALHVDDEHQVRPGREHALGVERPTCRRGCRRSRPTRGTRRPRSSPRTARATRSCSRRRRLRRRARGGSCRTATSRRSGICATSRSTTVVLPAPDGADTTNSRPRRPLLDILHLLAHLLELRLDADDELRARPRPSAFEPIVFTSRFISCSRKSSLRPHGSGAVARATSTARRGRGTATTSSLMSERAANRTISCATARRVGRQVGREVADALGEPRLARGASPRGRHPATRFDQVGDTPALRRVEIGAQLVAFVAAHRVEVRRAPRSTASHDRRLERRPSPASSSSAACSRTVERLREPQQVARRAARPATRPASRACVQRRRRAPPRTPR